MRHLPEILFWEAACTGVWLLTLSSVTRAELITALVCALPCAVLAVLARHAVEGSWLPRAAWARWLLPLPVAVVADTVRILRMAVVSLLGRPIPAGEVRRLTLTHDRAGRQWRGRQSAAVVLVSAAPGTVVLHVEPDDGETVLHALGSGPPRMEEVVRR